MAECPVEISAGEIIVRGICSPYHVKNDRLKASAFMPPPESDEISVMRYDYLGGDGCKQYAKRLADPLGKPAKEYCGLAALAVTDVTQAELQVVDSRSVYMGHADIKFPFPRPRNEPADSQKTETLKSLADRLRSMAKFFRDVAPDGPRWTGPDLRIELFDSRAISPGFQPPLRLTPRTETSGLD